MTKSKIVKFLWIVAMVITQCLAVISSVKAVSIGETKDLERGELGYYCVQKWNGSGWIYLTYNQTFYTDTDGQRYLAYCLSPGLPGVGYVPGEKETYQVRVKENLNNNTIWRVLKNGYPNKSVEDLGVETEDDAYFATMQAINAILRGYSLEQAKELYTPGQFAINGESIEDIQRRGSKTLNAMYNLIDIGLNGTETREQLLSASIEETSELQEESKELLSQTFKVQSQSDISKYEINELRNLPEGSFVADLAGNQKQIFEGGELFKIMIPRDSILDNIKGEISIKVTQKNYPIYYGASSIEGCQDYALCNNSYSEVYANKEVYIQTDKSKLTIRKIDANTKKPIKGVKFQIIVNNEIINTVATNEDGIIQIANLRPGKVIIKEVETVGKYKLESKPIIVELKYNELKEIEIENELQKGNIKVIKIDKDNNKIKLSNVKFQLKDENNKIIKEGITDKKGELLFENIVVGNYKIVEVETNNEYVLDSNEIEVKVTDGNTRILKIENELKKGSVKIIKMDKEHNEIKLSNVRFQSKDDSNSVVKEGETNNNGELIFEDLPIGRYTLVELKSNDEYVVLEREIPVQVVEGKVQELNIENEKIKKEEPNNNEEEKIEKVVENKRLPKTGNIVNLKYKGFNEMAILSVCSMLFVIRKFL